MNTETLKVEKLNSEEIIIIASKFGCTPDYVRKINSGTRISKSRTAKSISKAIEIISENKLELKKTIEQINIEGE